MARLGPYCKAFQVKELAAFEGWHPDLSALRPAVGANGQATPRTWAEDDVVYLHPSLVVTDDVFVDEHVVFDDVTDAWRRFCTDQLGFEVPAGLGAD